MADNLSSKLRKFLLRNGWQFQFYNSMIENNTKVRCWRQELHVTKLVEGLVVGVHKIEREQTGPRDLVTGLSTCVILYQWLERENKNKNKTKETVTTTPRPSVSHSATCYRWIHRPYLLRCVVFFFPSIQDALTRHSLQILVEEAGRGKEGKVVRGVRELWTAPKSKHLNISEPPNQQPRAQMSEFWPVCTLSCRDSYRQKPS